MRWHVVKSRKALVVHLLAAADIVQFDDLDVVRVIKIGDGRIVEGNMPVDPDAQDHRIDRRFIEPSRIFGHCCLRVGFGNNGHDLGERGS